MEKLTPVTMKLASDDLAILNKIKRWYEDADELGATSVSRAETMRRVLREKYDSIEQV